MSIGTELQEFIRIPYMISHKSLELIVDIHL